ncbi:hypothetical protein BC830DRAFT_1168002 [Chytriomyces sp. MP71]|nr:hypothetical protein BC830DRAFT_1168002 [Chytriomyces sp. MP71]
MNLLTLNADVVGAIVSRLDGDAQFRLSQVSGDLRRTVFGSHPVFATRPAPLEPDDDGCASPDAPDASDLAFAVPQDVWIASKTHESGAVLDEVTFAQDPGINENWDTFSESSQAVFRTYFMNADRSIWTFLPFVAQFARLDTQQSPQIPYFEITVLEKGLDGAVPPAFKDARKGFWDGQEHFVEVNNNLGQMTIGVARDTGCNICMTSNNYHTGRTWESISDDRPNVNWGIGDTVGCGLLKSFTGGLHAIFTVNGEFVFSVPMSKGNWHSYIASQGQGKIEINFGQLPFKFSKVGAGNVFTETLPASIITAKGFNSMGDTAYLPWVGYKGKYHRDQAIEYRLSSQPFGLVSRLPSGHDYVEVTLLKNPDAHSQTFNFGLAHPSFFNSNFGSQYNQFSVAVFNLNNTSFKAEFFMTGDVIGVGYSAEMGELFVTKNGRKVDLQQAIVEYTKAGNGRHRWVADLNLKCLSKSDTRKSVTVPKQRYHLALMETDKALIKAVEFNFGQKPFLYSGDSENDVE